MVIDMSKIYLNYVFKNLFVMGFIFLGSIIGFLLASIFITRINFDQKVYQQYLVSAKDNKLYFDTDRLLVENSKISEISLYANNYLQGEFRLIFNYDPIKLSLLNVQFSDIVQKPIFAKDLNKKAFLLSGKIKKDVIAFKLATILIQPIDNNSSQISLNCSDSNFGGVQGVKSQICPLKVNVLSENLMSNRNDNSCDVLQIRPPKIIYINPNQSSTGIDLAWKKESSDQSVSIFYKQIEEDDWSVIPNIKSQNRYQINNLNPEKSYVIKAFSSNSCVQSDFSAVHLISLSKKNKSSVASTNDIRVDSTIRKDLFYKTVEKIALFPKLNKLVDVLVLLILSIGWFSIWLMGDFIKNINNIDINNKY